MTDMSNWPEVQGGQEVLKALDGFNELLSLDLLTDFRASAVCDHQPSVLRQVADAISVALDETTKAIENADLKADRKKLRSKRKSDYRRANIAGWLKDAEAAVLAPREVAAEIDADPNLSIETRRYDDYEDEDELWVMRRTGWLSSTIDSELTWRLRAEESRDKVVRQERDRLQQWDDETEKMVAAIKPNELINRRTALVDLEVIVRAARIVALNRTLGASGT